MFHFAGWFLAQQNNCLRIVEGQCLLCQLPHWRASMTSVQKRKWRNWSPVLSQCGVAAGIAHREPLQSSQSTVPSLREVDDAPTRELRQRSLPEGFNASTKEILDRVWMLAFYEANIPFNVVRHPTFIHAVHETARL